MIEDEIRQMVQDYDRTARTHLVIVPVIEVTCTRALTLKEYETKIVTGNAIIHVIVIEREIQTGEAVITTEDRHKKRSLREWGTGRSTLARQGKNTTTIANRKSRSGRNPATGSIGIGSGKNVTENAIDVTETVIATGNMRGHPTRHLGQKMDLQRDIPVLLDLMQTTTVVGTPIRLDPTSIRPRIETTTEAIISHSNLFPSRRNPEDIAMVGLLIN